MRQKPTPPVCKAFVPWLNHHLGKGCLAPCTGQDAAALKAFAHLLEVYAHGDARGQDSALRAMAALVDGGMQRKVADLAKRMIPHVLEWSDEERIWRLIEDINASPEARRHREAVDAAGDLARLIEITNSRGD